MAAVLTGPDNPLPRGTPQEEDAAADAALIEQVARKVVQMGLAAPAVFFLESTKPLSFIGSQALVFLEPFVKSVLTLRSYDRFVAMLEDRKNIEKLLVRIEDLDEEARAAEKERKKQEKESRRIAAAGGRRETRAQRVRRWFFGGKAPGGGTGGRP